MKLIALLVLTALLSACTSSEALMEGIRSPNIALLPAGTYTGQAFLFPVSVTAEVAVADGRITAVHLPRHFHGRGQAAEAIIDQVIAYQTVELDSIAGATHSTAVILKAIEDALQGGDNDT